MGTMNKKDRIAFVRGGLQSYERLNAPSKARTSREQWIAFKLSVTPEKAATYIAEALAADKDNG